MGPTNIDDIIGTLNEMYSQENIDANLEGTTYLDYSDDIASGLIANKNKILALIKKIDWRKIPKQEIIDGPSLWWEGSDAWNDLADSGDTSGLQEYLSHLHFWMKQMATRYHAYKKG